MLPGSARYTFLEVSGNTLLVRRRRFQQNDPLCCPSGEWQTLAGFRVNAEGVLSQIPVAKDAGMTLSYFSSGEKGIGWVSDDTPSDGIVANAITSDFAEGGDTYQQTRVWDYLVMPYFSADRSAVGDSEHNALAVGQSVGGTDRITLVSYPNVSLLGLPEHDMSRITTAHGLRLGSTREDVRSVLGPPKQLIGAVTGRTAYGYRYIPNNSRCTAMQSILFVFDRSGRVEAIQSLKQC
jgi:hypothetical protein